MPIHTTNAIAIATTIEAAALSNGVFFRKSAMIVEDNAITAPTERSIPPVSMTKVIPIARIDMYAISCSSELIVNASMKLGLIATQKINIAIAININAFLESALLTFLPLPKGLGAVVVVISEYPS